MKKHYPIALSIVVPVYNEEMIIEELARRTKSYL
jgi:cellulose synthase/poly-beta-1,6-N-acetylglucosamine synthase-like glycosyltransferase